MKTSRQLFHILAALAAGLFVSQRAVSAVVIISDNFNGTNNVAISGRAPNVADLPGGTFIADDYFGQTTSHVDTSAGNAQPSAYTGANNDTYVSIASSGSYVKPSTFTISGDLQLNTLNGGYVGLGFFPVDPGPNQGSPGFGGTFNAVNGFYGVALDINGFLQLRENGVGTPISSTFTLTPAFNNQTFYSLSYDVNTVTGDISNIVLSNGTSSATYDATSANFTNTNTKFAAFGSVNGTGGTFGHVDNFSVTTVPEPGTLMLCCLGIALLLLHKSRRGLRS